MLTVITDDAIRELARPLGWIEVKICAVSEAWSGLKLLVRKALRCARAPLRRVQALHDHPQAQAGVPS